MLCYVFIIPLCRDMIAADFVIVCVSCSWWLIHHFLKLTHQGTNTKHTDTNALFHILLTVKQLIIH